MKGEELKERFWSVADWILEVRRTGSDSEGTENSYLSAFKIFMEATEVSRWDTFTLEELSNYCSEISGCGYVEGKHLVFIVQEFSTLSDYYREIFLTVCSKIVSDGNYRHVTNQRTHQKP